jgi:hypothetical protein
MIVIDARTLVFAHSGEKKTHAARVWYLRRLLLSFTCIISLPAFVAGVVVYCAR